MQKIRLGRTGLMVTKTAMGCLPVQRCNDEAAIELLRAAYDGGLTATAKRRSVSRSPTCATR